MADKPVTMHILDYPTNSDAAQRVLKERNSAHIIQLMQASDMNGDLIMPDKIMDHLQGAVVWMRFTVEMFTFCKTSVKATYITDIYSVKVVAPPGASTDIPQLSPKKVRAIYRKDPLTRRNKGKGKQD